MSCHDQLEVAAAELHCAAAVAEERALGNPLDPWWAIAGTIRLVAAGLDPMALATPLVAGDVHQHLATAKAALDGVPVDDAPSDVAFWRAHIVDLDVNAHALEGSSTGSSGGNS